MGWKILGYLEIVLKPNLKPKAYFKVAVYSCILCSNYPHHQEHMRRFLTFSWIQFKKMYLSSAKFSTRLVSDIYATNIRKPYVTMPKIIQDIELCKFPWNIAPISFSNLTSISISTQLFLINYYHFSLCYPMLFFNIDWEI